MYLLAYNAIILLAICRSAPWVLLAYNQISSATDHLNPSDRSKAIWPLTELILTCFVPTLLVMMPLFSSLRSSPGGTGTGSVVCSLLGTLAILIVTIVRAVRHRHKPPFLLVGDVLLSIAAGTVVLIAAVSQLAFASGNDASNVGFGSFRGQVHDMNCASNVLLVKWRPGDVRVRYRCPTDIVLNRYASTPFVPWPDYTEGTSADLAAALNDMVHNAVPLK